MAEHSVEAMWAAFRHLGIPDLEAHQALQITRDARYVRMLRPFYPFLLEIEQGAVRTRLSVFHEECLADRSILQNYLFPSSRLRPAGIRVEDISPYDRRALVNTIVRNFPWTNDVSCIRKHGMLLLNVLAADEADWNSAIRKQR